MIAIFIDGPLRGEVMEHFDFGPIYRVPLPRRITVCDCNASSPDEWESPAGEFVYHAVCRGQEIVLYSKHDNDGQAILNSLKEWIISDLTHDWHLHCRDRRAFA